MHVLGTSFRRHHEQLVEVLPLGRNGEEALLLELPRHRTRLRHRAADLVQLVLELGECAVAVVGRDLNKQRDATRRVRLVDHLFDLSAVLQLARTALDGAFDVVLRHILCLGAVDCQAQSHVHLRVATLPCGDRDLPCEARKCLAALRVVRRLLAFNR